MPLPPSKSLILVTGVTGYIAAHVAEQLLQKGYSVRGTVRTASKAEYLKKRFEQYGQDKFSYVIVEDLIKDGAFDEAVKGVQGIMHVASPFHFNITDPYKDLIEPAKKGTISLLQAAHKNGQEVARVVVTSSFAAVAQPKDGTGYVYTEEDWNTFSSEEVKKTGDPMHAYRSSKYEAEKAAWDFIKENKPKFDLSTINPVFVFGPLLQEIKTPEDINTSVGYVYKLLTGETKEIKPPPASQAYVDVRDVALAHVKAIETEEAGGNRYLTVGGMFGFQQVANILREAYPDRKDKIPEGYPKDEKYTKTAHIVSSEKAKKTFGIEFISLEKTILDTAKDLEKFL